MYLQQIEDGQVFTGLGHHALVGRNDQQCGVNASHSGQHVFDEVSVTRDVDDAHLFAGWEGHPGEAQVDGHLALLLFPQPVGVDPGQGQHQGRFAMIHMAGGPDYPHARPLLDARTCLARTT